MTFHSKWALLFHILLPIVASEGECRGGGERLVPITPSRLSHPLLGCCWRGMASEKAIHTIPFPKFCRGEAGRAGRVKGAKWEGEICIRNQYRFIYHNVFH